MLTRDLLTVANLLAEYRNTGKFVKFEVESALLVTDWQSKYFFIGLQLYRST